MPDTESEFAIAFINQTNRDIFITGKAGTGKTTLLKEIKVKGYKKTVVTAPTGVAAMNAGGITLNSLFQLPPNLILPVMEELTGNGGHSYTLYHLLHSLTFSKEKTVLLNELEVLIIDEISMVRADILDAINAILQFVRKNNLPFGGVQMVYIGDLCQLPPIATDAELTSLRKFYRSPFFFEAQALKAAGPVMIELKTVYRQNDQQFLRLLNGIRTNTINPDDERTLAARYMPQFISAEDDHYITLTSHNNQADQINTQRLKSLPGSAFEFQAVMSGSIDPQSVPLEQMLRLKAGAQIMFIRNDKSADRKFFNGKIGIVDQLSDNEIIISCDGEKISVEKEKWETMQYKVNGDKNTLEAESVGEFIQYPIKLAWAVTIHKSQGLTFDKAIVDAGASFAPGQVYVALSRVRSLQGLVLRSRIDQRSIVTSPEVLDYINAGNTTEELEKILDAERKLFIILQIKNTYNFSWLLEMMKIQKETLEKWRMSNGKVSLFFADELVRIMTECNDTGVKFIKQIEQLLVDSSAQGNGKLLDRIKAGNQYFSQLLNDKIHKPSADHRQRLIEKSASKELIIFFTIINRWIESAISRLNLGQTVAAKLTDPNSVPEILQMIRASREIKVEDLQVSARSKVKVGISASILQTAKLFNEGNSIEEIATLKKVSVQAIQNHIAELVKTGNIPIESLIPLDKVNAVLFYIQKGEDNMNNLKERLGEAYSFFEIRLVLNHSNFPQNS